MKDEVTKKAALNMLKKLENVDMDNVQEITISLILKNKDMRARDEYEDEMHLDEKCEDEDEDDEDEDKKGYVKEGR